MTSNPNERKSVRIKITKKTTKVTELNEEESIDYVMLRLHTNELIKLRDSLAELDKPHLAEIQDLENYVEEDGKCTDYFEKASCAIAIAENNMLLAEEETFSGFSRSQNHSPTIPPLPLIVEAERENGEPHEGGERDKNLEPPKNRPMSVACSSHRCDSRSHNNDNENVKLPRLDIESFDGSQSNFQNFFETFNQTIHFNDNISYIDKLRFLKKSLKDEPYRLISKYRLSQKDYFQAYQHLIDMYGSQEAIIETQVMDLYNIKTPTNNYNSLRNFMMEMETGLRGMLSLDLDVHGKDLSTFLSIILLNKLPTDFRFNLDRHKLDALWSVALLQKALRIEIRRMENNKANTPQTIKENSNKRNDTSQEKSYARKPATQNNKNKGFRSQGTVSAYNIGTQQARNETSNTKAYESKFPPRVCVFCNEKHGSVDCLKYKTVKAREQRITQLKACKRCGRSNHNLESCLNKKPCFVCKKDHNVILCPIKEQYANRGNTNTNDPDTSTSAVAVNVETISKKLCSVVLPTAMLMIESDKDHQIKVRTLIDQCAQASLIKKSLAERLKMKKVEKISLRINGYDAQQKTRLYDIVSFVIKTDQDDIPVRAIAVDNLNTEIQVPGLANKIIQLKKMDIKLADDELENDYITGIQMLLGADHYNSIVIGQRTINGIRMIKSRVGYMLSGPLKLLDGTKNSPIENVEDSHAINSLNVMPLSEVDSEKEVKDCLSILWDMDSIGLCTKNVASDEKKVSGQFNKSLKFEDGHYLTGLPWRNNHKILPHNYALAKGRLLHTLKGLRKNPELLQQYNDVFLDQIDKKFIEKVDPNEPIGPTEKIHFLPHQAVIKQSVSSPIRIVMDASAGKTSLNSCLYSGPPISGDLLQISLRFRMNAFAVSSDVRKAYMQIRIMKEDRNALRFLWLEDINDENSPLITYRFISLPFGLTCSAFILAASIKNHLSQTEHPLNEKILRCLYVDNLISTFPTEKEMTDYYHYTLKIFKEAGLELCDWISNSSKVNEIFTDSQNGIESDSLKVLGLTWDSTTDTMYYPRREVNKLAGTKRQVLQASASIYDPSGTLQPVTIKTRLFMQKLWKMKVGWDDQLPIEICDEWKEIAKEVEIALTLVVPRRLIYSKDVAIHGFGDASKIGYGACIYIVSDMKSHLIMAKGKVAPIKELTIPQMEISASNLTSRLIAFVKETYSKELNFTATYGWSDSQVCLTWLESDKPLKTYVQNRVDEINKLTPDIDWKYVKSSENPADMLSRGIKASKFIENPLWLSGPTWIIDPSLFPQWDQRQKEPEMDNMITEMIITNSNEKEMVSEVSLPKVTKIINKKKLVPGEPLIQIENYSSYDKIIKITMLAFRFIKKIKKKKSDDQPVKSTAIDRKTNLVDHNFDLEEKQKAEIYWIKKAQEESFQEDIISLKRTNATMTERVKSLNLFLDEDSIIRCHRRLDNTALSDEAKRPILLPNNHCLTKLLIWKYHNKYHAGVSQLMTFINMVFWFPSMRQTIKKTVRPCTICKRIQGHHYPLPRMPPLPLDRVAQSKPYTVVGLDYTGHFEVKPNATSKKIMKIYVVLFSCASSRAVHLDVTYDNSKDNFLNVLRRFVSKCSMPSKFISDNATTFVAAANYLKEVYDHPSIKQFLLERKIKWRFSPARSAHCGGLFERLIGLTKTSLKRIMGKAVVTYDEFRTILSEVELCLNSRPLTHKSDDLNDIEVITPAELLTGFKLQGLATPVEEISEDLNYQNRTLLSKRQRYVARLIENFWSRWQNEYLTALRQNYKPFGKAIMKAGDLVLVYDEGPRLAWRLARILRLHEGQDGEIRSVTLLTSSGQTSRSIMKLYPLEVGCDLRREDPESPTEEGRGEGRGNRPLREAAKKAKELMKNQE